MKNKSSKIIAFLLFLILCLSVGYAAYGTELMISKIVADIRIQTDVRITNIDVGTYKDGVVSKNMNYNVDTVSFDINLPNETSTITYKIEVTNIGSSEIGILDISGLPDILDYNITGYKLNEKLCDSNGECKLGITKEFYITIGYKTNRYNSNNTEYNILLEFDFREVCKVSYVNIQDNNYPTEVLLGGDLNILFTDNIPSEVIVTGAESYIYNKPNLKIENVSGNVVITATVMYVNEGSVEFNGSNYINTGIYLFNEENINKNFEISFNIDNYDKNLVNFSTLINSLYESYESGYPGFLFRVYNGQFQLTGNNGINQGKDVYFNYTTVKKIVLKRIKNVLYYSINDGDFNKIQDYTGFNQYFDVPVTIGAALDENGEPYRYFSGTISNIKIIFLSDDATIEIPNKVYNEVYNNAEITFNGYNYVNTGIYLFNEENINKDFSISFTISDYNAYQVAQATLVNSMNESSNTYPGFVFRTYNNQYEIAANVDYNTPGKTELLKLEVTNVEIKRINNILYYKINNEEDIQMADYTGFNQYFDVPVTIGASLDENGEPYRYFNGTLTNIKIKLSE